MSDTLEAVALTVRMGATDTSVASVYVRSTAFSSRWDTSFVINLRAVRRRAQIVTERSQAAEHWREYNRIDAVCRRHARRRRSQSWDSL